jgi:hypothetical protein
MVIRSVKKGGVLKLQKGNPLYHTMIARGFTGGDYDYSGADTMPDSNGH